MNNEKSETITLRRDEKRPLKFNGETLRTAIRKFAFEDDDGTKQAYEHEATLYRTETGKYVLEFTIYDETNEKWNCRYGWANADLKALVSEALQEAGNGFLDNDILAEVFEDTELGEQFVEQID